MSSISATFVPVLFTIKTSQVMQEVTFLSAHEHIFIVVSDRPLPVFFLETDRPAYLNGHFIHTIWPCHLESDGRYWHKCVVSFPGADCDAAFVAAAEGYERELEAQSGTILEQDSSTL